MIELKCEYDPISEELVISNFEDDRITISSELSDNGDRYFNLSQRFVGFGRTGLHDDIISAIQQGIQWGK